MAYEVIIGEIAATVIAVGLPLILNYSFRWSERHGVAVDKEQEKYIIDAATNGSMAVWNEYTKKIKKYSIDGNLTEEEKKKARSDAIEKAKSIITDEVKKTYKRIDTNQLIEGAMEKVFTAVKKESTDVNPNNEVLDAVHLALKISMKKHLAELQKSINEGKFEEKKAKEIVGEVLEISKNFMNKKIVKRIDANTAGNKDRLNEIIMKEMYKMLLPEEKNNTT
jgi:hypothetical protein